METKKSLKANLERRKMLFFEIGLIAALSLCLLAFEWNSHEKTIAILETGGNKGALEDDIVPVTTRELPTPPEVKTPVAIDVIIITDEPVDISPIILAEVNKRDGIPLYEYAKKPEDSTEIEDIPVAAVEEKPQFMGGNENEFSKWVAKNMTYPEIAKENRIQGRVICSFVVTAEGKVADVKILRGVDPSLDKEAVRVISMSPQWTPGKQRSKAVRVRYTFPVIFRLR